MQMPSGKYPYPHGIEHLFQSVIAALKQHIVGGSKRWCLWISPPFAEHKAIGGEDGAGAMVLLRRGNLDARRATAYAKEVGPCGFFRPACKEMEHAIGMIDNPIMRWGLIPLRCSIPSPGQLHTVSLSSSALVYGCVRCDDPNERLSVAGAAF